MTPPTQGREPYELWVNTERTVLVRRWPDGSVEVALRESPEQVWCPPIKVEAE